MRVSAVALLLVLAACGGGSDPASTTAETAAPPTTSARPTVAVPTGVPAPEALSDLLCDQNERGAWGATGLVTNTSKRSVTFQVTVFVGPVAGSPEQGKTRQVVVKAGGSATFVIHQVPAADDDGPCHVQVLATD